MSLPSKKPSTFAFSLRWGFGDPNDASSAMNGLVVDESGQATFTRDPMLGPATARFVLTPTEMSVIYEALRKADFTRLPAVFTTPPVSDGRGGWVASSMAGFRYLMAVSGVEGPHRVDWTCDPGVVRMSEHRPTVAMRGVVESIMKIVEAKPEYKALPPPSGGYV